MCVGGSFTCTWLAPRHLMIITGIECKRIIVIYGHVEKEKSEWANELLVWMKWTLMTEINVSKSLPEDCLGIWDWCESEKCMTW